MSFGTGPYGALYGVPSQITTQGERSSLSSSRSIDPRTRRYQPASDGGFEAMDDVAQRVLLYISFNVDLTDRIDPRAQRTVEQRIRTALTPMTQGAEPDIRIEAITVSDDGRETSFVRVEYTNLRTNTMTTVER